MNSPQLLGVPMFFWGGLFLLLLLGAEVLIGLRIIKLDFKYHRYLGLGILALGLLHAFLGYLFIYGG